MTKRKIQRCIRALERFSVNHSRAETDAGYRERKSAELASLERTARQHS